MTKRLLLMFGMAGLLLAVPNMAKANEAVEIVEQVEQSISVAFYNGVLHVSGANGQTLQIYNVTGVRIMSFRVEGNDKRYELSLPKGCYIVKVGKVVRKISIN
ncbi:MAG: T9SS type A sorting domain-containing protein [Prevotella sp.]|nr:T9SS type A sorting domain-containing protein [Prevotella sp.]MDD7335828.1 T9SS type A sorting domain-containing protein [Prevotella sp.]MDY4625597.1 T9SS type A sorting domain-containing protein [Prevotella sp.]MDY4667732.1 T9SS type A sorting domain-containing protein [Prevotella sp.]MDY5258500.1 T9SS type A sorting domain-containing protein [Prevotella sp.]